MTFTESVKSIQAVKNGTAPRPTMQEAIDNVYRLTVEWQETQNEIAIMRGVPNVEPILKKLSYKELAVWNQLAAAKQILQFIVGQQKS